MTSQGTLLHPEGRNDKPEKPPGGVIPSGGVRLPNKSLAEFALASAKKVEIIFSGGVYVGENTARLANVRRMRRRRALRAMQRAAAFSNESPVKRVSFESLSKILF